MEYLAIEIELGSEEVVRKGINEGKIREGKRNQEGKRNTKIREGNEIKESEGKKGMRDQWNE